MGPRGLGLRPHAPCAEVRIMHLTGPFRYASGKIPLEQPGFPPPIVLPPPDRQLGGTAPRWCQRVAQPARFRVPGSPRVIRNAVVGDWAIADGGCCERASLREHASRFVFSTRCARARHSPNPRSTRAIFEKPARAVRIPPTHLRFRTHRTSRECKTRVDAPGARP